MQTDPDPSPSQSSAESAVGLTFVAVVLVSLFVAGSLGVIATREAAPAADAGQEAEGIAVASASTAAMQVRNRIVGRFGELMLLREIARLRSSGRRLDGLRLPVKVFDAFRPGNGSWVVVARVGRSPARLVTGSGRQVRATKASAAVYRCTLVRRDGSWRLLDLTRG